MFQGEVDGCWAGRVVANGDDLLEPQGLHDRLQIAELLREAVARALWLVGCAEAQEVYCHRSATGRRQMRNEVVVNVRVVRKSVQHCESRSATGKVPDVQASAIALDSMFSERRESCVLGIRHDLAPLQSGPSNHFLLLVDAGHCKRMRAFYWHAAREPSMEASEARSGFSRRM